MKATKILVSALILSVVLALACFSAADTIFFGFDDNKIPAGLSPNISGYTIADGIVSYKDTTTTDPFITYSCNLKADDYDRVVVRIKYELIDRGDDNYPKCQVFYTGTDASGNAISLSEGNSVSVPLGGLSSEGEFKTFVLPLHKANLEGATIKSLRFDIVNCKGSFGIDYIMLVPANPNADLIYEFNSLGDSEGWYNANLTAGVTVKDGMLSGTNKESNGLIGIKYATKLPGADYQKYYIRMKTSGLTSDASGLLYTDLYDADGTDLKGGWWLGYGDFKNVTVDHAASNDGKWMVHTYDLSTKNSYKSNYFKEVILNNINVAGPSFDIDYVAIKNTHSYEWTFDHEGLPEGWTVPNGWSISDGAFNYIGGSDYSNPMSYLYNLSIDASKYDGIEVIMKHNLKGTSTNDTVPGSTDFRLYYSGVAADGSAISFSEANTGKVNVVSSSSGDSYLRYYIDLSSKSNWDGATITTLRIDPINENGDFSIDYMRLVPNDNLDKKGLDQSLVSASYEFEDEIAGNADGTLTVDIGGQSFDDIKKVTVSWADENGDALSDYSIIKAYVTGEFRGTYTANKNMLIPNDAKKLVIAITDIEKTFKLTVDIPESKLPEDLGEPLYTAAFISDIHVGGWGSETAPNARLVAAREQINEYADFVVINGDLTQWYGAYSGEEFKAYNYNGSSFGDNGETDTSILDQKLGTSQWTVLREYFESFDVPVYPVQGNHDIRDGDGWNAVYYQPHYWLDTFHGWLDYSNTSDAGTQMFTEKVEYSNEHNYYDAWVDGHHYIFLEMPKIPSPNYAFGEEQLAWLDKKLYENESTGKPVFIFTHVPTESNVNASFTDNQIRDDADFKAVLAKHPTAIVVSGHTHYSLDIDAYSSHNGAQEEFSVIHDGGTTTINVPNGSDYEDTTEIAGSHGIIAEVYADRILLRGRDFASDKWLSKGYTLLTFKDAPDFEVTAERSTDESGNTVLTASNVSSDYTCTWIVDGAETAGASVTLTGDADYAALRITDKNGLYASMLYDDISDIPEKKQSSLEVQNGVVKVTGVTNPSYLIIVSYKGTRLHDVYIKPVSDNINVNISETTLDTSGCDKITAIVLKKTSLSPLFPAVSQ